MENSWFLSKPLIFHRTIPDTNDLTSDSSSSMSKTLRSTLMENSWFSSKPLVFHRTIPDTNDLTSDSNSPPPIALRSRFMKNISLYFYLILRPISEVRTDKQSSRQFFF